VKYEILYKRKAEATEKLLERGIDNQESKITSTTGFFFEIHVVNR
jgi:hypothetical protein